MTDRTAQMYEETLGKEAAERQKWASVDRHPCCGERMADGHHFMCSKRPPDEPAAHVDGQQGLL